MVNDFLVELLLNYRFVNIFQKKRFNCVMNALFTSLFTYHFPQSV